MKVHNTLGRRLEPLSTRDPGKATIYVCGPTVQSEPHLGHGRAAVAFDVVRRYLEWRGFDVTYVQNVTDVEDKIIAAAIERGTTVEDLAEEMNTKFTACYRALGVQAPDVEPKATEHIPQMLDLIETLITKGLAYPSGGDVYFAVRALPGYGRLSGRNLDDLRAGARVEPGEHKRDPLDFALWKAAKPGEPSWDSPWGPGRPGWHIECSAMATEYLGEGFDIHGGGSDLIFPHHENEIAQSEGAGIVPFARFWMHNGMVNLGGEKMAKSTGHVIDLATAIERYGGMAVRIFYLRAQYRSPLEYSEQLLADAAAAYERLQAFERRLPPETTIPDPAYILRFRDAMEDDFNTPEAVAALFDAVKDGNRILDEGGDGVALGSAFRTMAETLGVTFGRAELTDLEARVYELAQRFGTPAGTPAEMIDALLARRATAREEKDWATSDAVRDGLAELGITVEDTADGARWHRT
jgi:cysteinyl-tRNA synthetase